MTALEKKYIEKIAIFRKCNMCKYLIISWCKTVLSRLSHYFFLPHLFLFLHLYIILWPLIHSSEVYNFSTLSVSTLHFSFLLPPFLSSPSAPHPFLFNPKAYEHPFPVIWLLHPFLFLHPSLLPFLNLPTSVY